MLDFLAPLAPLGAQDWSEAMSLTVCTFVAGMGVGQILLFSLWAALGPEPWRWRLPGAIAAVAASLAVVSLGCMVFQPPIPDRRQLQSLVLLAPLLFCAAQTPAWALRLLGRWRVGLATSVNVSKSLQFRVPHLFSTTAAIALFLGAARLGISQGRTPQADDWLRAAMLFGGFAVFSVPYTLSGLWIGIGSRHPWRAAATVGAALILLGSVLAGIAGMVVVAIGGANFDAGLMLTLRVFAAYLVWALPFHVALLGVLVGGLLPFRAAGYDLRPER